MPKRKRLGWYSFYKNAVNTIRAVTPIPPPLSSVPPVRLPCGALFLDRRPTVPPSYHLAPIIPNRLGAYKSTAEMEEMRRLRTENPTKWSISALSARFNVAPAFVINKVLSARDRGDLEKRNEEHFVDMSKGKLKGSLVSARIRQIRESSF